VFYVTDETEKGKEVLGNMLTV